MSDLICFGEIEFPTQVAITEEEQSRGLMFVEWPPPVLSFPYRSAAVRKYWMKNTPSPLDIVFCYGGQVVDSVYGEPFSDKKVGPDTLTDLVVELPHGMAARFNITAGTPVQLTYSLTTLAKRIAYTISKRA